MIRAAKTSIVAMALTASALTVTVGPADAAAASAAFANCDAMHRTFPNGVARSRAAARRQVRSGHFRPAVRPRVYRRNRGSDADHDGTACEVTR